MMNDTKMSFYEEDSLSPKQLAAAQKLPVQTKFVQWTDEEKDEFTEEQMFLVECKVNGATYSTLREYFNVGSDNSIASALKKTAMGYKWQPHSSGGSSSFMSDVYIKRLKGLVKERCLDLDAMKTVEVMDFFVGALRNND